MTIFAHITVKTVVRAGLCVTAVATAVAMCPHAAAQQLKTGGYKCVDGAAAAAGGAPVCAAAAVEAAGVVPPAAPPIGVPPVPVVPPAGVPPVPLAPPPVAVPPVPLAPPVPVVPAAPVPAAAPIAAPIAVAAGTGKGVPTVSPGGGPVAGAPTLPGPADPASGG